MSEQKTGLTSSGVYAGIKEQARGLSSLVYYAQTEILSRGNGRGPASAYKEYLDGITRKAIDGRSTELTLPEMTLEELEDARLFIKKLESQISTEIRKTKGENRLNGLKQLVLGRTSSQPHPKQKD